MTAEQLQERTKKFALDVLRFVKGQANVEAFRGVARQLARSATSVAANYRAACRARSRIEFAAKLGVVSEEADETVFWLELIVQGRLARGSSWLSLLEEARQLRAIMAASASTARRNLSIAKSTNQINKSPDHQIKK